jgi:hypothetical protein
MFIYQCYDLLLISSASCSFCDMSVYCLKYSQRDATLYKFFIIVTALHISGGFSAHHQELKNSIHSIWYVPGLFAATASGGSKQASNNKRLIV